MAYQTKADFNDAKTITLGKDGAPKSVEGYFLGTKVTPDKGYGPGKLHFFQTKAGIVGVWGKTVMNNLLTSDLIGQMTLVTFTGMGEKKKGKNPAFLFKVQHDADNTVDVMNTGLSAMEAEEGSDSDSSDDSAYDSSDTDSEEAPADEAPAIRAQPPRQPAQAPSADRAARVQALLNKNRSKAG